MNDGEYDLGHLKKKSARGAAWRMLVNGQGSWVWAALGSHPCYCSNVRIGTTSLSVGITLQFCFRTFCSLTQLAVLDLRIKISPLLEAMPKSLGLTEMQWQEVCSQWALFSTRRVCPIGDSLDAIFKNIRMEIQNIDFITLFAELWYKICEVDIYSLHF